MRPLDRARGELVGIFVHTPFAFFGGCIASIALILFIDAVLSLLRAPLHGSTSIYNPVIWVPSLFIGVIVNRSVRHRWAFLFPALLGGLIVIWFAAWKVFLIERSPNWLDLAEGHPWSYEFRNLFSFHPSTYGEKGIEQLFVTFPFLSSVAYGIGALLSIRFGDVTRSTRDHRVGLLKKQND